jgi:hypothetical protein
VKSAAPIILPVTFNVPVTSVFVLTLKPFTDVIDAVADPCAILDKFSPTILAAGILVNPLPSPLNDPVKEPVVYEDVKSLKLEVKR